VLTGPERIAALEGQAGTGKGVVLDTVARAERMTGRQVLGIALAGATAERLGHDSPALHGRTTTIASLLHHVQHDPTVLNRETTVILDEAGMVDTPTLQHLTRAITASGAKLIAVGDGRQLPAIGPGGMFDHLARQSPRAELEHVHRTQDPAEQRAWRALRDGKPDRAMAHYLARDQLHLTDHRDQALHAAVDRYHHLALQHGHEHVALMSDGAGHEIERMNARAQHLRHTAGQLGRDTITLPQQHDGDRLPYDLRTGDLVTWRQIQRVPREARIENGTRGTITHTDERRQTLTVRLTGSDREVTVTGPDQLAALRLGYAQHVVRQQGATVDHAVALTGGWQTSQETAYVQASRARHGIDWYISREDLGQTGTDPDRIQRLADKLTRTTAKTPSITHQPAPAIDFTLEPHADLHLERIIAPHIEPDVSIDI
jgi:ATP-dependent exoDNAse (exonuclease V) alpha subunit